MFHNKNSLKDLKTTKRILEVIIQSEDKDKHAKRSQRIKNISRTSRWLKEV